MTSTARAVEDGAADQGGKVLAALARIERFQRADRAELVRALQETLRAEVLLTRPVTIAVESEPADLDDERAVLACVRERIAPPEWLRPEHFFLRVHGAIYAAALGLVDVDVEPTSANVLVVLQQQGFRGADVDATVAIAFDLSPAILPIEPTARRLVALHVQRAARAELGRARIALADSHADASTELAALEQRLAELRAGITPT